MLYLRCVLCRDKRNWAQKRSRYEAKISARFTDTKNIIQDVDEKPIIKLNKFTKPTDQLNSLIAIRQFECALC